MQDLLLNPAVQSGLAPALAAIVAAALVGRGRALALIPLAGFAAVVWLAVGFSLEVMSARSKTVLAVGAAGILAVGLDLAGARPNPRLRAVLVALAAAAAVWVAIRVLQQKDGAAAWTSAALVVAFAAAMLESTRLVAGSAPRGFVAGAALGFTLGVLGLLGASASVAMMGIAFGSACGVGLIAVVWRGSPDPAPAFLVLPVALFAVLGALVATLTGELPAVALLALPLVPVAIRLVPGAVGRPAWRDALIASVAALPPAAVAVALAAWPMLNRSTA